MGFNDLVSKICAGGLSAGVFLIWWPAHVAGDGLGQLVLRGLLWTLTFELLLVAFVPLERLVIRSVRRRVGERRLGLRDRVAAAPARARAGGAVALACVGAGMPILLLTDSAGAPVKEAQARPKVVKQVIVKRPVVKREVVVKREPVQAAPAPAPEPVVRRVVVERVKRVRVPATKATPAPATQRVTESAATTPAAAPQASTPPSASAERVTGAVTPAE
jgi:hypothetical protein